ncbi:putative Glycogen synthase kinase-3 beta [Blattamonas nauphoetae]|uniref:Glycogen synthase kinase-3 beta n=1 Tax=Blattamonas nauphoetae TaxID=2049346 RepID=A0ABQ9Y5L5_9EUKA|nr:putative Glycogen synthase kinase-3 beta [Blattamonas nauphoetae]
MIPDPKHSNALWSLGPGESKDLMQKPSTSPTSPLPNSPIATNVSVAPPRPSIRELSNALAECREDLLPSFDTNPIHFSTDKAIGSGSFGTVFQGVLPSTGEIVAVKKVLQDPNFKNRELLMMRVIDHPNCVRMKQYFYSRDRQSKKTYLNIVMENIPHTLYNLNKHYISQRREMPTAWIKIYSYQLIRSLLYIHGFGITHRDIKPQNILINPRTGVLKLCDFGSAKILRPGEVSVAYICSRYYRAPELVFGTQTYDTSVDIWSAGCVIAELLLGRPLFPGDSPVDQLVKILQTLGTPSREDMIAMGQAETPINFPHTRKKHWVQVFPASASKTAIDLVAKMLVYDPAQRIRPIQALQHPLFDELRDDVDSLFPDGSLFPPFFNFTPDEMEISNGEVEAIWRRHKSRFANPRHLYASHTITFEVNATTHTPPQPSSLISSPIGRNLAWSSSSYAPGTRLPPLSQTEAYQPDRSDPSDPPSGNSQRQNPRDSFFLPSLSPKSPSGDVGHSHTQPPISRKTSALSQKSKK